MSSTLPTADPDELARLNFLLEAAQKTIDEQLDASEQNDAKSAQMLQIGLASVAGAFALAELFRRQVGLPSSSAEWTSMVLVALGIAAVIAAEVFFVDAFLGLTNRRAPVYYGSSNPTTLHAQALTPSWTRHHIIHGMLAGLEAAARKNDEELGRLSRRRRRGLWAILAGMVLFASAGFIYVGDLIVSDDPGAQGNETGGSTAVESGRDSGHTLAADSQELQTPRPVGIGTLRRSIWPAALVH